MKPSIQIIIVVVLLSWAACICHAASAEQTALRAAVTVALHTVPTTQPAAGLSTPGVQALFYDGPEYQHKPARVFAWYGFPSDIKPGTKVPAMVLIHGGGGTAFAQWVVKWNKLGYAAIAMDTCGCVPIGADNHWQRDERGGQGGPPGWGGFDQIDQPVRDQWTYHAVLDVILAHSLIRSWPQVDADRVGVTGISWGGYLTCIVAGLDNRFRFACPVYGCGFLGEDSGWLGDFKNLGLEKSTRWLAAWDPSEYLPAAKMPMLWVDGTNDRWYPPDSLSKSYHLPRGTHTLVMRVAMKHSHSDGWAPEEIATFADSICKGGVPLAKITSQHTTGNATAATYESSSPIIKAELNFTTDHGEWMKRKWQIQPADLSATETTVQATLPDGLTAYYINLIDSRGRIVSTDINIP